MSLVLTSAVVVFRIHANTLEVLLVDNISESDSKKHKFGVPGGRLEEGENFEAAARRELLEETGLLAEELILLPKTYQATMEKEGVIRTFQGRSFLCKSHTGHLVSSDETRPCWVAYSKVREIERLRPNTLEMIDEAKGYI